MELNALQSDLTLNAAASTPHTQIQVTTILSAYLTDPQGNYLTDPQGNRLMGNYSNTAYSTALTAQASDPFLNAE